MSAILGVFSPLRGILRFSDVSTDNNIFKLHYRVSVLLLSVFTILVSSKQFFGDPIHCIGDNDKHQDALNSYCWLYGTHTVKKHLKGTLGTHMAHFGVGPFVRGEEAEISHQYYQWVCIILPLQAFLFYAPHALWKIFEGGKIKGLTEGLNSSYMPTEWDEERRLRLIKHLINTNKYTRNIIAYQFFLCEILNFCNVVLQIVFLDKFLGGLFTSYGATVVAFYNNPFNADIVNPMDHIFPKVTKCLFQIYGSSGSIQTKDLMCILPLNIINEKIFMFLWFWLILLAVLSGLALIYRFFALTSHCLRGYIITTQAKLVPKYLVFNIICQFRVSDWFVLHLIGKNVNCFVFKDLITLLGEQLDRKNKNECDVI